MGFWDRMFDIISKWDHFGQGVFFLLVFGCISGVLASLFHCVSVLFRGHPKGCGHICDRCQPQQEEDE